MHFHKEKLLKQGYVAPMLKSSAHKFYRRHHHLVEYFEISISNDDGSYTFYVDVFFSLSLPTLLPDLNVCMSSTAAVF